MASEASVNVGLQITKGHLSYQSKPTNFKANVANIGGPTPGTILVSIGGTDINLDPLGTPGLMFVHNLDPTNYVTVGAWDQPNSNFLPLFEIMPGECYVYRVSRHLGSGYGPGTGTGSATPYNTIRLRANTAACLVRVECFEK